MATRTLTPDLLAATQRGMQRLFTSLWEAVDIGPWGQLYSTLPPGSAGENYPAIGAAPQVSAFTGERKYTGLRTDGFYVLNEDYDAGLEVPEADIERDSLGKYTGAMQEMVEAAKVYPQTLMASILANGTSTTLAKCWDGAALFSASHGKDDGASQSNIISGSGVDTLAHVQTDIAQGVSAMARWKNDKGVYRRAVLPNVAFYPAENYGLGLFLDTIKSSRTDLGSADQSAVVAAVIAVPELTGNDWYLAAGGGGLRPFGYQEEIAPRLRQNYEFNRKVLQMSVDMRGAAFCAHWTHIVMINNT